MRGFRGDTRVARGGTDRGGRGGGGGMSRGFRGRGGRGGAFRQNGERGGFRGRGDRGGSRFPSRGRGGRGGSGGGGDRGGGHRGFRGSPGAKAGRGGAGHKRFLNSEDYEEETYGKKMKTEGKKKPMVKEEDENDEDLSDLHASDFEDEEMSNEGDSGDASPTVSDEQVAGKKNAAPLTGAASKFLKGKATSKGAMAASPCVGPSKKQNAAGWKKVENVKADISDIDDEEMGSDLDDEDISDEMEFDDFSDDDEEEEEEEEDEEGSDEEPVKKEKSEKPIKGILKKPENKVANNVQAGKKASPGKAEPAEKVGKKTAIKSEEGDGQCLSGADDDDELGKFVVNNKKAAAAKKAEAKTTPVKEQKKVGAKGTKQEEEVKKESYVRVEEKVEPAVFREETRRMNARNAKRLYVSGFHKKTTVEDLKKLHSNIIYVSSPTSIRKRYAFLHFPTEAACSEAFEALKDKAELKGVALKIDACGEKSVVELSQLSETADPLKLYIGDVPDYYEAAEVEKLFPKANKVFVNRGGNFAIAYFGSASDAREAFESAKDLKMDKLPVTVLYGRARRVREMTPMTAKKEKAKKQPKEDGLAKQSPKKVAASTPSPAAKAAVGRQKENGKKKKAAQQQQQQEEEEEEDSDEGVEEDEAASDDLDEDDDFDEDDLELSD